MRKNVLQGLKPSLAAARYGTAKPVPLVLIYGIAKGVPILQSYGTAAKDVPFVHRFSSLVDAP